MDRVLFLRLASTKPTAQILVRQYVKLRRSSENPIRQGAFLELLIELSEKGPKNNNLDNTKRFYPEWTEAFYGELSKLSSDLRKEFEAFVVRVDREASNVGSDPGKLFASVFRPLVAEGEIDIKGFVNQCVAEDKGHYLLMRLPAKRRLVVSEMVITYDPNANILPVFRTESYENGSLDRVVNGVIVKLKGAVYSLGGRDGDNLLRTTSLNFVKRPNRMDLYGVRTGFEFENGKFYPHLIYAYQLSKERREVVKEQLRHGSQEDLYNKVRAIGLESIDRIVSYLTPVSGGASGAEYGFQPRAVQ